MYATFINSKKKNTAEVIASISEVYLFIFQSLIVAKTVKRIEAVPEIITM